jgi:hypothetical protein
MEQVMEQQTPVAAVADINQTQQLRVEAVEAALLL